MRGFLLRSSILAWMWKGAPILVGVAGEVFFLIAPAWSGAFNQPAGTGQVITTLTAMQGDFSFGSTGKLAKTPLYRKGELSLYIEYGVTGWLMAIARPAAETVSIGPPTRAKINGLGDSEAGLQLRLFTLGDSVFALRATGIAPGHAGSHNGAAAGHTAGAAQADLVTGYSFSLGPWPSFIESSVGYRRRGAPYASEWRSDAAFGTRPLGNVLLLLKAFTIYAPRYEGPVLSAAYSLKAQASVVYDIDAHWSVEAGAFTTLIGRSSLRERGALLSVWRKF